mgnify:FL=1|tara:strand:+ start:4086 stop:4889 length:804 start_codon:yes stop_codon:yes gene_type:complete
MIIVLLPAYNEEKSLPQLIPKLKQTMESFSEEYCVIVCNDGSTDSTQKLLDQMSQDFPIEVIHHKINRGLGETSRDLFEHAAVIAAEGDIIVRLDCDDTHEPEFIPKLIKRARNGCDVVIASRFEPGGGQMGVSKYRAFISRSANYFMKIFFPISGLKEYSCGFRAYRAEIIKEAISFYGNNFIQLKGLGFTCTLEKLVKLKLIGASFGEEPFLLRYDQKLSDSKMVSSVTTLGYLVMTLLYHWPWGGWRSGIKKKYRNWNISNDSL